MMKFFQAIVFCVVIITYREAKADTAQKWSPRNKYWRHILKEQSGLEDGNGEHFEDMQSCVQTALSESSDVDVVLQDKTAVPTIVDTLKDIQNRTILVEIGDAITPSQVESVKRLAACARLYFPESRFEHRDFEGSGGGNDVTYLNILLQIFLPEVFENVVNIAELAYEKAGWGEQLQLLPPNMCGLRTSEYLHYKEFKRLGGHTDAGSLYTVLFALSDPKLYQGGEFYLLPRDEPDDRMYYFKPRQYSAIVFLSETHHGVTDLEGPREMFTNEFWVYDDAPWHGSARARNSEMDVFVQRVKETLDHAVDYYKEEDLTDLWPFEEDIEDFDGYDSGYGFYEDEEDELNANEDKNDEL
jgi:hypothetical protein